MLSFHSTETPVCKSGEFQFIPVVISLLGVELYAHVWEVFTAKDKI